MLQIAAAEMSAHGIRTPPPTKMPVICPSAVKVAVPPPIAVPNKLATPAKEMPENPEPSNPVIAPAMQQGLYTVKMLTGNIQ